MNTEPTSHEMRLHVDVSGHVQGVGFRYFVLEHARELGLTGWVRNSSAGKVEVLAEGSKTELETLLSLLQRGPAGARVSDARFSWSEASGEFDFFRVSF